MAVRTDPSLSSRDEASKAKILLNWSTKNPPNSFRHARISTIYICLRPCLDVVGGVTRKMQNSDQSRSGYD